MAVLLLWFLLNLNVGLAALSPLWVEVGGLYSCDAWAELVSAHRAFMVLRRRFPAGILLGELLLHRLTLAIAALIVDAWQTAVDVFANQRAILRHRQVKLILDGTQALVLLYFVIFVH